VEPIAICKVVTDDQQEAIKRMGKESWSLYHDWLEKQKEYILKEIKYYEKI
jgi:hypothetical protein